MRTASERILGLPDFSRGRFGRFAAHATVIVTPSRVPSSDDHYQPTWSTKRQLTQCNGFRLYGPFRGYVGRASGYVLAGAAAAGVLDEPAACPPGITAPAGMTLAPAFFNCS
jgi:hypothetical protein